MLLLIITGFGHLAEIRWSVCISKSLRSLCVSFARTDSGLCIYHLFVWSNLNFLDSSQWITLPTQRCLVLYSFCVNFLYSNLLLSWLSSVIFYSIYNKPETILLSMSCRLEWSKTHPKRRGDTVMTLNCIKWWGSSSRALGIVESHFHWDYSHVHSNSLMGPKVHSWPIDVIQSSLWPIDGTPGSFLTHCSCWGPIYGSRRSGWNNVY